MEIWEGRVGVGGKARPGQGGVGLARGGQSARLHGGAGEGQVQGGPGWASLTATWSSGFGTRS